MQSTEVSHLPVLLLYTWLGNDLKNSEEQFTNRVHNFQINWS